MNTLPVLAPHSFTVICAPHAGLQPVTGLLAEMALRGPVTVLDCGNRFPAYRLLRLLGQRTSDPAEAAARVGLRRAFTCYQVLALLDDTPPGPWPCFLLDPLATFFDEQVPLAEVKRLLDVCLLRMERLSRTAPLLVALAPARTSDRAFLVERACARADRLYTLDIPSPLVSQPALF